MPKTNWLTDVIIEAVDEALDMLEECLSEDYGLGLLQVQLDQDEMRARFMEIANAVDLPTHIAGRQAFVAEFGQDVWDKQAKLGMGRLENGR